MTDHIKAVFKKRLLLWIRELRKEFIDGFSSLEKEMDIDYIRLKDGITGVEKDIDEIASKQAMDINAAVKALVPPELRNIVLSNDELLENYSIRDNHPTLKILTTILIDLSGVLIELSKGYLNQLRDIIKTSDLSNIKKAQARLEQFIAYSRLCHIPAADWPDNVEEKHVFIYLQDRFDLKETPKDWREIYNTIALKIAGRINSSSDLARIYVAENIARRISPSSPTYSPAPVSHTAVRTLSALSGAHPETTKGKSESAALIPDDLSAPTKLQFRWADGNQLTLDYSGETDPLLAVARKYGDTAARDLLGLCFFSYAAQKKAGESFWWWPAEQIEKLNGRKPTEKTLGNQRRWLDNMADTLLVAEYKQGSPIEGPLVSRALWTRDRTSYRIHLHPTIFTPITNDAGLPENQWWPLDLKLFELAPNQNRGIYALAVFLGQQWRISARYKDEPVAVVGVAKLVEQIGIKPQKGRTKDKRAADTLRRALDTQQDCGYIEKWWHEGGDMDRFTGVIKAIPKKKALEIIHAPSSQIQPAPLPETGNDVRAFREARGWTYKHFSRITGVSENMLKQICNTYQNRPLPYSVRSAMRKHLWPK